MSSCVIYMATHKLSGKRYVGVSKDLTRRRREHMKRVGLSPIADLIKSEGSDNFEWTVLRENVAPEEAGALEQHYIAEYDTFNRGLNRSRGGVGADRLIIAQQTIPFMFRIPVDLKCELAKAASADGRTLSNLIVNIMQAALKRKTKRP